MSGARARATSCRRCAVTPDRYASARYAGASGDFNPIHLDDEFARSVGLPGRILHGLYTMALLARAADRGARRPRAPASASRSSSAAPRVPEQEITIESDGHASVDGRASSSRATRRASTARRSIRGASAELEP